MGPPLLVRLASVRLAQAALREQIDRYAHSNIVYRAERIEDAARAIAELDELIADLTVAAPYAVAAIDEARRGGR